MFSQQSPASGGFGRLNSSPFSQPNNQQSNNYQSTNSFAGNNNSQFGLGSSSAGGWGQGNSNGQSLFGTPSNQHSNNSFGGHSEFGGAGPQFGQGSQSQQPRSPLNATQSSQPSFGGEAKRAYLPGYLSSRTQQQSESTPPPKVEDSRSWDSPVRRSSISGSPVGRFGGQSLFGNSVNTPSRSPQGYTREPVRASAYDATAMEEDAPPIESLGDFDGQQQPESGVQHNNNNTQSSAFPSTSAPPSHSASTTPAPPATGYAVHLFGFPSEALPAVLAHFSALGDVVSTTPSPEGGNWVTIAYAQPWSAARAARKNGTILGGVIMVGVKVVDEELLRRSIGSEGLAASGGEFGHNSDALSAQVNGNNSALASTSASSSAPKPPSTPSGVGKPIQVFAAGSAFKAPPPSTPRRGLFGAAAQQTPGAGTPAAAQAGASDPHASLFSQKSQQAVMAQNAATPKGVIGKMSDLVFGW